MSDLLKQNQGFTLLEIMLTITIVAIAAVSMLAIFSSNIGFINNSEKYSQALQIARSSLEELKGMAHNDWNNFLTNAESYTPSSQAGWLTNYNVSVTLENYDLNNDGNLNNDDGRKTIVTVAWADEEVDLQTIIINR